MSDAPVIVSFRESLRLSDHPALSEACAGGAPVICLFVFDEQSAALRAPLARPLGGASRWWLAQSLQALARDIEARGGSLTLRKGPAAQIITELARECRAKAVYWPRIAIAPHDAIAKDVREALGKIGVRGHERDGDLLIGPERMKNPQGRGPRVFTPFWKRIVALGDPPRPIPAPKAIRPAEKIACDDWRDWGLVPERPDWAGGLRATWQAGEAAAQARLNAFLDDDLRFYSAERDRPDRAVTSRLSPHLRFGEISPRQVWHATRFSVADNPALTKDADKFLSELGWREFSRHLLHDLPALASTNLQATFDAFPWRDDDAALRAWQRGQTGYPLVDAGMRELWMTGTMHNRVRMVVASFLIKHLLIDWRAGEAWFWDTLVDADPASNPASWQWVAGSGADAAPYYRIFNPVLQSEKFDPDGGYVRRFVPELARLPADAIHAPWLAPPLTLAEAGVTLGVNYPAPIVDHAFARQRALAALATTKR